MRIRCDPPGEGKARLSPVGDGSKAAEPPASARSIIRETVQKAVFRSDLEFALITSTNGRASRRASEEEQQLSPSTHIQQANHYMEAVSDPSVDHKRITVAVAIWSCDLPTITL